MKLRLLIGTMMLTALTAHAQVASINENFESFNTGAGSPLPQNGWTSVLAGQRMYPDASNGNKYLQAYTFFTPNVPFYAITPQIIAPTGNQTLSFKVALTTGSGGSGSIQAGLVSSNTDMATFTPISGVVAVSSTTAQTLTYSVPASSSQYIAFKFIGNVAHAAILIDDVSFTTSTSLGVSDLSGSKNDVRFAVNTDHTALHFVTSKDPRRIQIYSPAGQKVSEGKLSDKNYDISTLQTGVYYIIIETAEGQTVKSKFIKK